MDPTLVASQVALWVIVLLNLVLTLAVIRRLNRSNDNASNNNTNSMKFGVATGDPAPYFVAETVSGEKVTAEDFKERPVLYLFVAPTCKPCVEALPSYQALYPEAQRNGTDVVLVSLAGLEETRAFVREHDIKLKTLVAPRETNSFIKDYKIEMTPAYCIVDAKGVVRSSGYPNPMGGEWKKLVTAGGQAA